MTRTVGELLERYLCVRGLLQEEDSREIRREESDLKGRLVTNYSPLVKYVAGRVSARSLEPVDREDLLSWGIMGLLDAISTYVPEKGAKFETYAISKIRWAMLDHLRKQDWKPRSLRERAQEYHRAHSTLGQRLRRDPVESEVAEEMGLNLEEYRQFIGHYSRAPLSSLESRVGVEEETELKDVLADVSIEEPLSEAEKSDLRRHLVEAMSRLGERELQIVSMYFYEGLTLREIGRSYDLSEGRISQILGSTLSKLQERLRA